MPRLDRLLDANLNRAAEGLRTLEDFARFFADDAALAARSKHVRRRLAGLVRVDVAWRDAAGDVGAERNVRTRDAAGDVARAAGQRVTQALRVLEEALRLVDGDRAGEVERLRYLAYDLARDVETALRPRSRLAALGTGWVYLVLTASACRGDPADVARAAAAGGVKVLQLREPDLPAGELLARARGLRDVCRAAGVLFVVNDRPDVAVLAGADGVHVGQADLPPAEVRRVVGPDMLIGVSTHDVTQVRVAAAAGADYVGVGPVYPSPTKPRDFLPGLTFAAEAADAGRRLGLPTVAVGGITPDHVSDVWACGVSAVAVTSAVTRADDPARAVRALAGSATL